MRHAERIDLSEPCVGVSGRVRIEVIDVTTGHITRLPDSGNLVVWTGLNVIRDRLSPTSTVGPIELFGLGASSVAASPAHEALQEEISPKLGVARVQAGDVGQLSIQIHITSTQFNGATIREAGLFTAGEIMVARYALPLPLVKTNTRAVTFTWYLQFGAV